MLGFVFCFFHFVECPSVQKSITHILETFFSSRGINNALFVVWSHWGGKKQLWFWAHMPCGGGGGAEINCSHYQRNPHCFFENQSEIFGCRWNICYCSCLIVRKSFSVWVPPDVCLVSRALDRSGLWLDYFELSALFILQKPIFFFSFMHAGCKVHAHESMCSVATITA